MSVEITSLKQALSMPLQVIFDTVVVRMLAQGKSSYIEVQKACAYESPDGSKCAVGLLLSTEEQNEVIARGCNYNGLNDLINSLKYIDYTSNEAFHLLRHLQNIHDDARAHNNDPEKWRADVILNLGRYVAETMNGINGDAIPTMAEEISA